MEHFVKKIVILLLTVILIFPSVCLSEIKASRERSDKWILFGKSEVGVHYYDKSSIEKVTSGIIKVWTKVRLSKIEKSKLIQDRIKNNLPTNGWEDLSEQKVLTELDCVNKTSKINKLSGYNYQGAVIHDLIFPNAEIKKIIPESIDDGLLRITCNNNSLMR